MTVKDIYVDFVNGNDSSNGSDFAQRVKTLAKADNLSDPGDTIRVMGSVPTKSAVESNWTNGSTTVKLLETFRKLIYSEGAWTSASPNITASTTNSLPGAQDGESYSRFVAAGFTTGKIAYFPRTGTPEELDLSQYQRITLWVGCTTNLPAGRLRLDLCSDALGNTIVHSAPVNVELLANKWTAVTVDLGQLINSGINSIRLTALASIDGKTIFVDNIYASMVPLPLTKTLYLDGAWTASANITATAASSSPPPRQGVSYAKFAASGFTTGKIAYLPFGSPADLSRYQQVSMWIGSSTGLNAGRLRLDLCSDTVGDVIVHSVPVNIELFANKWAVLTVDLGQSLSTNIQSLRLTATSSINNKTVLIDNVVACKAPSAVDCLTLSSLISPDGKVWYHVQSIDDSTVVIDGDSTSVAPGAGKGYQGETVVAPLQLLQPTISQTLASNEWAQTFVDVGTAAAQITITGGWDPIEMKSQTGLTRALHEPHN